MACSRHFFKRDELSAAQGKKKTLAMSFDVFLFQICRLTALEESGSL